MNNVLPRITALAHANPEHDIHEAFIGWARGRLLNSANRAMFDRMTRRSGIAHRFAVLEHAPGGGSPVDEGGFYARDPLPGTAERMAAYARLAPELAIKAIASLGAAFDPRAITHLVLASCTGFVSPGIDQIIATRLGLGASIERSLIGFMGCYAGVTALRTARHIVRSEPGAQVLVVTVELSSLHLQPANALEPLLAMLQFGDGAAAAVVSATGAGLSIESPFALTLPDSDKLIRWEIGDHGFAMHLSGEVPGRIARALADDDFQRAITAGMPANIIDAWAVHAGGRSILDAVAQGLRLDSEALEVSRAVLHRAGNMSSATLLFALAPFLTREVKHGRALAFGPGLAAEGFAFRSVA